MPISEAEDLAAISRYLDGYQNLITGLGIEHSDPTVWNAYRPDTWLRAPQLEALYTDSAIAARIVDRIVDDACRVTWKAENDGSGFDWTKLQSKIDDLHFFERVAQVGKWSRLYGGAVLILAQADGVPISRHIKPGSLIGLSPVDGESLQATKWDPALGSAGYMNPIEYTLSDGTSDGQHQSGTRIHHTRVIRFDAMQLPPRVLTRSGNGWGPSILQRSHKSIARLETTLQHAEAILQKISVLVVRIKEWNKTMNREGGVEDCKKMLRNLMMGVSNLRMMALDTDDELAEIKRSLEGVDKMIDRQVDAVVRDSDQPRLVVLGESPPGSLGDRASSEKTMWNNRVSSWRRDFVTPALTRVLDLLGAPPNYTITYESLDEEDRTSTSTVEKTEAETDAALVESTIAKPSELRKRWIEAGRIEEAPIVIATALAPAAPAAPETTEIAKQALTGVQLTSLVETVEKVSMGALAPAAAKIILGIGFPSISDQELTALVAAATPPPPPEDSEESTAPPPNDLVSIQEAASRVGVSTRTLTRQIELGKLSHWGFGTHRQVSMAEVLAAGKSHEAPEEEPDAPDTI